MRSRCTHCQDFVSHKAAKWDKLIHCPIDVGTHKAWYNLQISNYSCSSRLVVTFFLSFIMVMSSHTLLSFLHVSSQLVGYIFLPSTWFWTCTQGFFLHASCMWVSSYYLPFHKVIFCLQHGFELGTQGFLHASACE